MQKIKALILVDLQNDFMPGGALAVPCGHEIVPIANELQKHFDIVISSQDWHPANHGSFAVNHPPHQIGDVINLHGLPQVLWPSHCVQHTPGAELIHTLDTIKIGHVVYKGTNPDVDSYSVFFDNARRHKTEMDALLKSKNVTDIYLLGLATDYCVKYSALDGCYLDYTVYVIEDACRGIDLRPGDVVNALKEMKDNGAHIIQSNHILNQDNE